MSFLRNPTLLALLKIILAFLLGLFVLLASSAIIFMGGFSKLTESKPWVVGFINHTGMLFVSFVLISILARGRISTYGFRITENLGSKETIIVGLIAGFIVTGKPTPWCGGILLSSGRFFCLDFCQHGRGSSNPGFNSRLPCFSEKIWFFSY